MIVPAMVWTALSSVALTQATSPGPDVSVENQCSFTYENHGGEKGYASGTSSTYRYEDCRNEHAGRNTHRLTVCGKRKKTWGDIDASSRRWCM